MLSKIEVRMGHDGEAFLYSHPGEFIDRYENITSIEDMYQMMSEWFCNPQISPGQAFQQCDWFLVEEGLT